MWKWASAVAAALALLSGAAAAEEGERLGLGRPATAEEIAAWDIDVRPDGIGLPSGEGSVAAGEEIFTETCAGCHGDFGEGVGRFPPLAGGFGTLTDERPVKTIGSFWPYLSTAFDYIRRAQPFHAPGTLSDYEIYAVVAYILYLNDLVDEDFTLSRKNFTSVRLPNEANFVSDDRAQSLPKGAPCIKDCAGSVSITARASALALDDGDTDQ